MTSPNSGPDFPRQVHITPAHFDQLRARFATAAEAEGILDVAYGTLDTPVGNLLLAGTEAGLVRIAYDRENHDAVLQSLADRISPRLLHAPARLDEVATELEEYFGSRRTRFDVTLDWRLSRGFRADVLHHLATDLPYGQTTSYGTVAELIGNPKAVRAVGTACATNPLPIVVPCRRVVRTGGSLGGYLGGPEARRTLLTLEHAA
ncbi:MAG: methylated-DNA--[protein]-cysteine S-methyltransferase [Sciscionella sp.]